MHKVLGMLDALVWSYYRRAYMLVRKNINPDICLRMLKYGQNKLNIRERESMGQMAVKAFGQPLAKEINSGQVECF